MSYQPFYITQYEDETGFENYFESFLLPEKAFPILEDAYCWRGRVIKRGGTFLLGRPNRNLVDITLTIQASGGSYVVADLLAASPLMLGEPLLSPRKRMQKSMLAPSKSLLAP